MEQQNRLGSRHCGRCMHALEPGETVCPVCGSPAEGNSPLHHLRCGTVLREKYLVGNALGEGGFGITYIGRDLTLDMKIAVKEYYPNGFSNRNNTYSNEVAMTQGVQGIDHEQDMVRFLSEARTLARFCNEPGVVGVRDFFRENGTAYIIMEYLDGMTLKSYIRDNGPIPADTLLLMLDPILVALDEIHKQDLIHRDISPDNIMVMKNGQLKLLDFGAARKVSGEKSLSVMLKPGYAPEEQYRSKGQQGLWTDVYAMCATIYKCITGVTPDESMQRMFEDELRRPSQLGAVIDPDREAALMQGLSVKSADRFQSMEALRKALRTDGSGPARVTLPKPKKEKPAAVPPDNARTVFTARDAEVPKPTDTAGAGKKGKKKGLPVILAAGAAVAVLAVGIGVFLLGGSGDAAETRPSQSISSSRPQSGEDDRPEDPTLPVSSDTAPYSYTLTQVGTISDPDCKIDIYKDVLSQTTAGGKVVLDYLGQKKLETVYAAVEYLGSGVYLVSDGAGAKGLVSQEGKELIGCTATEIGWPAAGQTERYLLVTDPESGTTVYDVETESFVSGVKIPGNIAKTMIPCGQSFLVTGEDGTTTLYDASGSVLLQTSHTVEVGDDTFILRDGRDYRVYDGNGQQTYSSNTALHIIEQGQGHIYLTRNGKRVILDRTGREVPGTFDVVYGCYDGVFLVGIDGQKGLIRSDGSVVVAPGQCESFTALGLGYYQTTIRKDTGRVMALAGGEGIVATDLQKGHSGVLTFMKGKKVLVIGQKTHSLTLEDGSPEELAPALIKARSQADRLYGVFDVFTGQQLLDHTYEKVEAAAGYLYAYKNGEWTVFQIGGTAV